MLYFSEGSKDRVINAQESSLLVDRFIESLKSKSKKQLRRVLLIPPDFTRFHSGSGELSVDLYHKLTVQNVETVLLPALGTHFPMDAHEKHKMFPGIPDAAFREHHFRNQVVMLGEVKKEVLSKLSDGQLETTIQTQINRLLVEEPWDAIVSIGQLVPHEVIGIANHIKNILIGVGGFDLINKSHWLGAICGIEKIMGRARTPVRALLNHAAEQFLSHLPISYLLTIRQRVQGSMVTRGLFAGDGEECFFEGAKLCRDVNLDIVPRGPKKCVVYLDPEEFKTTWLGNKAVYRTRMMMADHGELLVLAPGVKQFGEDLKIDEMIRKYGYFGTQKTLAAVRENADLAGNLSAAAHLIQGSSEGRFQIIYAPGKLSKEEVNSVGFGYRDLNDALKQYNPGQLKDGWNVVNGEELFFVSNPALGLWGTQERFGTI
jgi:nickel-dependent lactate racemase